MPISALACLLAATLFGQAAPSVKDASTTPPSRIGAPYLLDVCAVSGEKIPADGGVVLIMDGTKNPRQKGREIRFCCTRCKTAFEKEPKRHLAKLDELIIADQLTRYPASVPCPVMTDETMPDPRGPEAEDCKMIVWNNRLVRLCCSKCVRMFYADPSRYIGVLDAAVIEEAKKADKVKNCVVNGRPLNQRANWFVVGDRAAATCCRGCEPKAMSNPRATVAKLEKTT